MPFLERSIPLLEKSYVPHDAVSAGQFAIALNTLGTAQLSIGEYDKAISTLQRSLAVNELAFGSASLNLVAPLNSLAGAYRTRGDVDRAQPLLERALRILEGAPSFMNSVRVDTLNNLAWMLLNIGDEDAALKLFSQAQDLGEKQLGSTAIPVASSLDGLALINERRGNITGSIGPFRTFARNSGKNAWPISTRPLLPLCTMLLSWWKGTATRIVQGACSKKLWL